MTHQVLLVAAAFLACAVEMVEALTIVLAVGVTRGWRSAIIGAATALGALTVVVAALGPALAVLPIDSLRLFVGGILLIFGLQWLRKAILRSSGFKAMHDEDAIFAEEQRAASAAARDRSGIDWYTFTVSFKGVFLEGLEVAFIVLALGAQGGAALQAAIAGALAAFVVVLVAGSLLHKPLAFVPENFMKWVVGAMLTTFGIFWGAEGFLVEWPLADATLLIILAGVCLTSFVAVRMLALIAPQGARVAARNI